VVDVLGACFVEGKVGFAERKEVGDQGLGGLAAGEGERGRVSAEGAVDGVSVWRGIRWEGCGGGGGAAF